MYPTGRDHQSCEGDERNNSNSKQNNLLKHHHDVGVGNSEQVRTTSEVNVFAPHHSSNKFQPTADGRKEPPFNMPKQQTNSPQFGISYSQLCQPGYPIQSASGFSACGMNMPPNSHMQRLPSDEPQYNFRPQDQQCTHDECQPKKRLVHNGNSPVTTNTLLGRHIQLPNPPPQIATISMGIGNAPFFVQPHLIWSETGRSGNPITASETVYEMNWTANGQLFPSEYNQYSDRLCCFHCGGVLERKEMDGQFIEHTRCYLDYYNRQSIKKYPNQKAFPTTDPDICGVCNTRKISVTQMNCRHIVCRQCLPKKDERGKYRCRICRKEVVKTVAYDVSCLRV